MENDWFIEWTDLTKVKLFDLKKGGNAMNKFDSSKETIRFINW